MGSGLVGVGCSRESAKDREAAKNFDKAAKPDPLASPSLAVWTLVASAKVPLNKRWPVTEVASCSGLTRSCLVLAHFDIAVHVRVALAVSKLPPDKRVAVVFNLLVQNQFLDVFAWIV